MNEYYFLMCTLPILKLDEKLEISFEELQILFELNLSSSDQKKIHFFLIYFDLRNLKALWQSYPIENRGNMDENELKEALLVPDLFPEFVCDYLLKYEDQEERLFHFAELLTQYFQKAQLNKSLVSKYFSMERELRLILLALRAKEYQKDLTHQLQFEDPHDVLVAYILAQKDMPHFEPPKEYHVIKEIFESHKNDPIMLERKLLEFRLQYLNETMEQSQFSFDQVLGYFISWLLIEHWQKIKTE